MFLLKTKNTARMFILTTPIQHCTEILLITMKQEKEIKSTEMKRNKNVSIDRRQDFLCENS